MTESVIIVLCTLLLLAYFFDISSAKTRIPSVILLLVLGYFVKQLATLVALPLPDLEVVLPILGSVGLILIVLEGSLELELNSGKKGVIIRTMLMAFLPLLLTSFGLAFCFQYFAGVGFKIGLANAIPLAVISSAIAIPSVQRLSAQKKEFITYESSLSDIFGVIMFNFITLNDDINGAAFGYFGLEVILILIITFIATMLLAWLLSRIKHHVKYAPIILMIVLIYEVAKLNHLPALIFILLFGLFIGNIMALRQYKFVDKLHPEVLNREVHKFKELTAEMAFLIRSLFFLLFGFLIDTSELLNPSTVIWSAGITGGIFVLRSVFLMIFSVNLMPLAFVAPRGLITILLFLNIPAAQAIPLVNKSLIIQVIVFTAVLMMLGMMLSGGGKSSKGQKDLS